MAFGIDKSELKLWKRTVKQGEIAFLTHYWMDDRFPNCDTVTKVGCNDLEKLIAWGKKYGLSEKWIDMHKQYPHFDLFGKIQLEILMNEQKWHHIKRFALNRALI